MAQSVLVTLTTAGVDSGPFDIYSDADGYTVPIVTGVSKAALLAGYLVTVPDAATIIKVLSTGVCSNYDLIPISLTTTTTSTSTSTTTSTSSTTTSTTTVCIPTLYLASTNNDACAQINGQLLTNISFTPSDECNYCNFTTLNSTEIPGLANGTYYVSDGVNVRAWTKTSTPSVLYNPTACSACTTTTTTSTTTSYCSTVPGAGVGCFNWNFTADTGGAVVQWTNCNGTPSSSVLSGGESGSACLCDGQTPTVTSGSLSLISQVGQCV